MSETTADMSYVERVEHYREDVPDDLEDTYSSLLSQGCAPRFAVPTLRYVRALLDHEPVTQQDITERYDISGVTLRKWARKAWEEHTGEEWDRPTPNGSPGSGTATGPPQETTPTAPRLVFHELYHAEEPMLTLEDLYERMDYSRGSISPALRTLANMGAVGGRTKANDPRNAKEWWAVPRADTPDHSYEAVSSRHSEMTVAETVVELAELRGWTQASHSHAAEGEYHYRSGSHTGDSASIRAAGWADLTGETNTLLQILELVEQYDIDLKREMSINFSVNKSGLHKVLKREREHEHGRERGRWEDETKEDTA